MPDSFVARTLGAKLQQGVSRNLSMRLRELVKANRVLLTLARFVVHGIPAEIKYQWQLLQDAIWPPVSPKMRAILAARSRGGAVSLAELETLWEAIRQKPAILCVGETIEIDQLKLLLSGQARSITTCAPSALDGMTGKEFSKIDLVILASGTTASDQIERVRSKLNGRQLFVVGADRSSRSKYSAGDIPKLKRGKAGPRSAGSLRARLEANEQIRVVVLNDVGFRFGAGIAERRQATSFLLNGWHVAAVAWDTGRNPDRPAVTGIDRLTGWAGMTTTRQLLADLKSDSDDAIDRVVAKVAAQQPDIVVVGNIHGAEWPIELFSRLQALGIIVAGYMHDCYLITGRCAHPADCRLYLTGCDETCPTADQYPRLAPQKIAPAWRIRGNVFTGPAAVPLVANSAWTQGMALGRYGAAGRVEMVHLGLDEALFAPVSKEAARRLLGLPTDKTIVLMGAVDFDNPWKGGRAFREVYAALRERSDIELILFGQNSEMTPVEHSFGLVRDERLMALIYNSADIFVSTAIAESFGQTLLEASACGVPIVAFNVGGVPDVVVNNETGLLIDGFSSADLLSAVSRLVGDPDLRMKLGRNGRARVEQSFTLSHQAKAWVECLKRLC